MTPTALSSAARRVGAKSFALIHRGVPQLLMPGGEKLLQLYPDTAWLTGLGGLLLMHQQAEENRMPGLGDPWASLRILAGAALGYGLVKRTIGVYEALMLAAANYRAGEHPDVLGKAQEFIKALVLIPAVHIGQFVGDWVFTQGSIDFYNKRLADMLKRPDVRRALNGAITQLPPALGLPWQATARELEAALTGWQAWRRLPHDELTRTERRLAEARLQTAIDELQGRMLTLFEAMPDALRNRLARQKPLRALMAEVQAFQDPWVKFGRRFNGLMGVVVMTSIALVAAKWANRLLERVAPGLATETFDLFSPPEGTLHDALFVGPDEAENSLESTVPPGNVLTVSPLAQQGALYPFDAGDEIDSPFVWMV